IFNTVEQMPRFPGCEEKTDKEEKEQCSGQKLMQYIYSNLRYPESAIEKGIEGRVVVRFVIDKSGYVTDVKILRDIGGDCGTEVKRVIESMNALPEKWIPGRQAGQKVNVYYTLPVVFKLSK
ncbi:MAG TPA: energy transducer TonB, partial [Bacteroidetes bacterium]|nr:energy transducer TonB [Bacteroidota bacterium]